MVTTQSALANGLSKSKTLLSVTVRTALGVADEIIITFWNKLSKFCPVIFSTAIIKSAIAGVKMNFTAATGKYKLI